MRPQIEQLKKLQEIDSKLSAFDNAINREQESIHGMSDTIAETEAAIADMEEQVQRSDKERKQLETEIEDTLAHIKERQGKIMQVQTNREYQSLLKEIEEGKQKNKARDERLVAIMEEDDARRQTIDEKRELLRTTREGMETTSAAVELRIGEINQSKKKIIANRTKAAQEVDPSLLSKYDLLRSRRNGTAIVAAINATCQGCYMNIPTQQFNELIRGERMLNCPICQRILFYQEQQDESA